MSINSIEIGLSKQVTTDQVGVLHTFEGAYALQESFSTGKYINIFEM